MNTPAKPDTGTFYGIGVGPGDPELLTLKGMRLINQCDLVTYLISDQGVSMARDIARHALAERGHPGQEEHPIVMPMCENREIANRVYDEAASVIAAALDQGKDVAFLCQGDPLFFGSFAYLLDRLGETYTVQAVPGVSSLSACASLTGRALGLLAENLAVVSGRVDDNDITQSLESFDNVVIMKPGRRRPRIIELIDQSGRSRDACYIEYAGMANQRIVEDITTLEDGKGPYFSLFLLNRRRDYR